MPFEIFRSERTERWYFRLKQGNGQTILTSEAYTSKVGAENGVKSVMINSGKDERYERKKGTSAGQDIYYFLLRAANGAKIGKGDTYNTATGMEHAIANTKKYGVRESEIKILTK